MKNQLKLHAKRELELLKKMIPDAVILPYKKGIVALCENIGKSNYENNIDEIVKTIKKLLFNDLLTPLTGEDHEWNNISGYNEEKPIYQNNRDSRVFKVGKNGKPYFTDAIIFNNDVVGKFKTNTDVIHDGKIIRSTQYIKKFPFIPKTFYIDVIDHKIQNEIWWKYEIMDEKQLDDVFKIYNMM